MYNIIKTVILFCMFLLSMFGCGTTDPIYGVGATGAQGTAGQPGLPCTVTPNAAGSLITCPDGTSAQINNGTNGVDGLTVSVVQFCPGVTPAYPTTFPEVGLCINGAIYAVYSANGGFFTEIVNGTYDSNAIGSACTFTVVGCVVSQ